MLFSFNELIKEKLITQQTRQLGFDNYTTTDDHLMEIIGRAKDQNRNTFYIIKNSWEPMAISMMGSFMHQNHTFVTRQFM